LVQDKTHERGTSQASCLGWRVEEEFISAIRGHEKIKFTTFEDGVKYMEFTDSVATSSMTGQAVDLPLGNTLQVSRPSYAKDLDDRSQQPA